MGNVRLYGATSGYTELAPPAVAPDGVLSLPSGTGTLAKETGAWTSWTPTWTASGATPSFGDGSLYAKYIQIGKTVSFNFLLSFGSTTTTTGTGWLFSLPVPAANNFNAIHGYAHNGNNGTTWRGSGFTLSNNIYIYVGDNTTSRVGSGNPGTWAANWILGFSGTYEAA